MLTESDLASTEEYLLIFTEQQSRVKHYVKNLIVTLTAKHMREPLRVYRNAIKRKLILVQNNEMYSLSVIHTFHELLENLTYA